MRTLITVACICAVVLACSHKKKLPAGIMPKEKMEAVLWDLLRAGEFLDGYVLNKDSAIDKGSMGAEWYAHVFALHHTTRAEFDKSYDYYREHPDLIKEVLDSISKKQYIPPVPPGQAVAKPDSTIKKNSLQKPSKPSRLFLPADSLRKHRRIRTEK